MVNEDNGYKEKVKEGLEKQWMGRTIEAEESEINDEVMGRSVVRETKARCFLAKLPMLCEEQGIGKVEVKLLGGLEIMLVMDLTMESVKTAENILQDNEHGIRALGMVTPPPALCLGGNGIGGITTPHVRVGQRRWARRQATNARCGENELDVMKQTRAVYRDENKNTPFSQEDAWEILRKHSKWDAPAPAPVDLTEDEEIPAVSTGGSNSKEQFFDFITNELRLKREAAKAAFEVAKEKDRTVMRLEEMKFLAISMKDLPEDDAYFIEEQKKAIRARYNLFRNPGRVTYEVSVGEEIRDIIRLDIQSANSKGDVERDGEEENDMQVDEDGDEDGNSDSDEGDDTEKEGEGGNHGDDGEYGEPVTISGRRFVGEDEGSRCSGETRVRDTFEGDWGTPKIVT
ncbi:hypothetical protein Tco_1079336 [Tanacetum coccineum]|uniref:Uncharacterized protein n=1 Tax=Tanacetum coccineum TaxID=301880 RepID=A0ABQ5HSM8_9ASTR